MSDPMEPYLKLRSALIRERRPHPIDVLPTDRERFGLGPWVGLVLGMRCIPSPVIRTAVLHPRNVSH